MQLNEYDLLDREGQLQFLALTEQHIRRTLAATPRRLRKWGIWVEPQEISKNRVRLMLFGKLGVPPSLNYELDHVSPLASLRWLDETLQLCGDQLWLSQVQVAAIDSSTNLQWLSPRDNRIKGDRYNSFAFIDWLAGLPGCLSDRAFDLLINRALYESSEMGQRKPWKSWVSWQ